MERLSKKSYAISFIRVVSMFMIIFCHALNENLKLAFLGQVFNVGVFIFLFLSGYLFGKKEIDNTVNWIFKRVIRIFIPMYVFMTFLFIIRILFLGYGLELRNYFIYLFNIQGILGGVQGAAHLWFLNVIMICYLLTPLLNIVKGRVFNFNNTQRKVLAGGLIIFQIVLSYSAASIIGRYTFYIILYIFAYYYSFLENEDVSTYKLIFLTIIMMLGVLIRISGQRFLDETIIYTNVIVMYSHAILGVWLFFILSKINIIFLKINRIVLYLDKLSFDLYIVHYMFFVGPFRVMNLTKLFILNFIIALFLSFISSIILNYICKKIYIFIDKKISKHQFFILSNIRN